MTFYKLYCLIYRRTDYFELDRIRRKLMYPEYYEEQEQRTKDKLMEIMLVNGLLARALNHEKWI